MKITWKTWFAMAAMSLTAAAANADAITFTPGTNLLVHGESGSSYVPLWFLGGQDTLAFSNGTGVVGALPSEAVNGLVGAFNVLEVRLNSLDGAVINETQIDVQGDVSRAGVDITASVSSLSADEATGQILTVGTIGGAQQVSAGLRGILDGGEVSVSNLRFDLINKKVIADVSGTPLVFADGVWLPGPTSTQKDLQLWNISTITGPTSLPPADLLAAGVDDFSRMLALGYSLETYDASNGNYSISASNVLGGLRITAEGMAFFAQSLGLRPGSVGYTTLNGTNSQVDGWGSVTSRISFASGIPEPSTCALMGLGLVGMALVARRRREA